MRADVKRKEFMDGACPKDAREQVTADLPEPECKNPPKSVRNLAESADIRGSKSRRSACEGL